MWILVYLITSAILFGLGSALHLLWKAGFWYIAAGFTPALFLIAYWYSSDADRRDFIDDLKRRFRLKNRR